MTQFLLGAACGGVGAVVMFGLLYLRGWRPPHDHDWADRIEIGE